MAPRTLARDHRDSRAGSTMITLVPTAPSATAQAIDGTLQAPQGLERRAEARCYHHGRDAALERPVTQALCELELAPYGKEPVHDRHWDVAAGGADRPHQTDHPAHVRGQRERRRDVA